MLQSKPSATTDQCMQFPDLKTFQINVGIVRAPLLTYKLLEPRLEGLKMDLERINATQYPTTTKKRQAFWKDPQGWIVRNLLWVFGQ